MSDPDPVTPQRFVELVQQLLGAAPETSTTDLLALTDLDPAHAFADQNFDGHDFSDDTLGGVRFDASSMREVVAGSTTFIDCSFARCDLSGAIFSYSNLLRCSFVAKDRWERLQLRTCVVVETNFSDLTLSDSVFEGTQFSNGTFGGITFENVAFSDDKFGVTTFGNCIFNNCVLKNVTTSEARFAECRFRNVAFVDCVLAGGDFHGADLSGCSFDGCDLGGAIFTNANVDDVAFGDSNLLNAYFGWNGLSADKIADLKSRGALFPAESRAA